MIAPHRALLCAFVTASLVAAASVAEAQVSDEITAKDGSRIVGDIVDMVGGKLKVKTVFGGEVLVDWKEVQKLSTVGSKKFLLTDETELNGTAQPGPEGTLDIKSDAILQPSNVALTAVKAINPPKDFHFRGNFGIGALLNDGNTRNRGFNMLGEVEARNSFQRLTLRGAYNYQDDETGVTTQYGKGAVKYDYFFWNRLYAYVNSLFEHDGIQDLNLRTALGGGVGYQVIDKGDFVEDWLKELQLYVEGGAGYFNEDFKVSQDRQYVSARWSLRIDWPVLPGRVTLFHLDEGYPSLERAQDIYVSTEQGVRLTLWKGFVASFQINWRWDNTPAPGFLRSDTQYIATLGYNFDF